MCAFSIRTVIAVKYIFHQYYIYHGPPLTNDWCILYIISYINILCLGDINCKYCDSSHWSRATYVSQFMCQNIYLRVLSVLWVLFLGRIHVSQTWGNGTFFVKSSISKIVYPIYPMWAYVLVHIYPHDNLNRDIIIPLPSYLLGSDGEYIYIYIYIYIYSIHSYKKRTIQ